MNKIKNMMKKFVRMGDIQWDDYTQDEKANFYLLFIFIPMFFFSLIYGFIAFLKYSDLNIILAAIIILLISYMTALSNWLEVYRRRNRQDNIQNNDRRK